MPPYNEEDFVSGDAYKVYTGTLSGGGGSGDVTIIGDDVGLNLESTQVDIRDSLQDIQLNILPTLAKEETLASILNDSLPFLVNERLIETGTSSPFSDVAADINSFLGANPTYKLISVDFCVHDGASFRWCITYTIV